MHFNGWLLDLMFCGVFEKAHKSEIQCQQPSIKTLLEYEKEMGYSGKLMACDPYTHFLKYRMRSHDITQLKQVYKSSSIRMRSFPLFQFSQFLHSL